MACVLVLEPDRLLRATILRALEQAGFETVGIAGAETAVHACDERQPDVIVLELQLQGHGGVEFIHELRSYAEWQDIPIILHTLVPRHVLEPYEQAFEVLNITAYTYKPATNLRQLVRLVRDVTGQDAYNLQSLK